LATVISVIGKTRRSGLAFCCVFLSFYTIFSIHPRYKRQIADRLALAGFAVAYGQSDVGIYQGPIPVRIGVRPSTIRIEYAIALEIRRYQDWSGFEASWTMAEMCDKTYVVSMYICELLLIVARGGCLANTCRSCH
jgi:hypothetical protein